MAVSSFLLLSVFISLLVCSYTDSIFSVPVFIWSRNSEVNSADPVLAGHTIKGRDFQQKYLNKLFRTPQIVGVFLQDRLSIDDISRYGDAYSPGNHGAVFSNLLASMETANSSAVLPSVEVSSSGGKSDELIQLIRTLANGLVKEFNPDESDKFDISKFSLDQEKTNVFIFHLLPASSSTPAEIFGKNDQLIGSVTRQISLTGLPYSCMLTAAAPSEAIYERRLSEERSAMAHDRLRRSVGEINSAVDANDIPVNGSLFASSDCILLYSKGFTFQYKDVYFNVLNDTKMTYQVSSECLQNTSDSISISFKGPPQIKTLELSFSFNANDSNGDWTCTEASLDIDGQFGGKPIKEKLSFNCSDNLEAPTKYSYSCVTVTFKNENENGTLTFKNFQVQPFNVKNGTFEYAYDCTGFFTIPIFMGLIIAGILILILSSGVLAMFSLTTMDRFDDPKGPGIHVPTG